MMIDSDSSSEEDICQEIQQMTIVKDEDSNIHEDNEAMETFKHDATEFDPKQTDAEQVSFHEVDEEQYETRAHAAAEADWLKVEDEAVEEGEGDDDLGEEETEAVKTLEEEGDDVKEYDDGDERYDEYVYIYEERMNDDVDDEYVGDKNENY